MARRLLVLGYGVVAYGLFVVVLGYTVCFLAGVVVPKGIDDGAPVAAGLAVTVDCGLLLLFAVQHSVMARPWFKRWWTRLVPPPAERERRHEAPRLRTPLLYRLVRHPLMVGFLVVFWAAPDMSVGRLLFAAVSTGYILVGIRFEERDLKSQLGEGYRRYLTEVPRFLPRVPLRRSARVASGQRNAS